MKNKRSREDYPFRSLMTFGTRDGAPEEEQVTAFRRQAQELVTAVPLEVQREFADLDHDMSSGSDGLLVVDGLITQVAAELCAADRILSGGRALLTMFHHSRAVFEAHVFAHWMLEDFGTRWPRVLKERQVERARFEEAAKSSIGMIPTDVSPAGRKLTQDLSVKRLPSLFDMIGGDAILEFDYAVFWKYGSSHLHPGNIYRARVAPEDERMMVYQILGGLIRHSAATYRHIAHVFELPLEQTSELLAAAEEYSAYPAGQGHGLTECCT